MQISEKEIDSLGKYPTYLTEKASKFNYEKFKKTCEKNRLKRKRK